MIRSHDENIHISIHYLGHASFVIRFGDDLTVLTDYGSFNAWVDLGWDSPIHDIGGLIPDVMTYSHMHHADHYDESRIPDGVQAVLHEADGIMLNGVGISSVRTSEESPGKGDNNSFTFSYKGLNVLHLGDCQADIMAIAEPDIQSNMMDLFSMSCDLVLMPIEGREQFISEAELFIRRMHTTRLIPMHYWSDDYKNDFLCYLGERTMTEAASYVIEETGKPDHIIDGAGNSGLPIRIISLEAGPLHPANGFPANRAPQPGVDVS